MVENLVIVESPAKASTIEKFLGKDYVVKSSFGHIRDLEKKDLGIEIENEYNPVYIVPEDKKKVVAELKKMAKEAKTVWLASDEDREGEAISWHLFEVLGLKEANTKRIVFNEITKDAILRAIKNPRGIDRNLVNAQQARRVLDRLVGFEISPILWRKVKPSLSAGRVQSVSVRLLVEREREINAFKSTSSFKVSANFLANEKKAQLFAELSERIEKKEAVTAFLNKCKNASFKVSDVVTKPSKKSPAAPFTTSTLQQEASRKLGFSVAQTMAVAQRLYEAGKITYMRTDSVNLSETAIEMAKKVIGNSFGEKYSNPRQYKTKSKGAQEAHEAIRPTYMENTGVEGSPQEQRLYELIWKRTIASQMSDALLEKTTITIDISTTPEKFTATGEVLKFDGFLKVYIESTDDENEENTERLLPPIKAGQGLDLDYIKATERFTHHPPRYTEASLVKKLEELGIGRPSTYAPTISTIQQRGYVIREDREGKERQYAEITLKNNSLSERTLKEITGAEKSKLFPSDIGIIVNDFLIAHFKDIIDFNFTANVEKEFDEIATGEMKWTKMIDKFYKPFHSNVEITTKTSERSVGERTLGTDPASGKPVIVKVGRYGPMAQIGEASDEEKPKFAGLLKGQSIETITLDEALDLFKLPRTIGMFEEKEMVVGVGRFGPYIRHDGKFYSLKPTVDNPLTIHSERAIEIINQKRIEQQNKTIAEFAEDKELKVLNGRWGAYISYKGENYKIPKTKAANTLTFKECMEIISTQPRAASKSKAKTKVAAKAKAEPKAKKPAKAKTSKAKKKS
ncbi:MAG TPA: type I DNA topoisomerase [Bacteroidales bacterium]|nr:type I DNA topoisomerase [Bacteroidales bacterium]